jgi:hypothetical protein
MDIDNFDGRICFETFAQSGNKDIHTAAIEVIIGSPDVFQCILSEKNTIFGRTKHLEKFGLFG